MTILPTITLFLRLIDGFYRTSPLSNEFLTRHDKQLYPDSMILGSATKQLVQLLQILHNAFIKNFK